MDTPPTPLPQHHGHVCDLCGQPDASRFGDHDICDACYTARGSCCAECYGRDEGEESGATSLTQVDAAASPDNSLLQK